MGKQNDQKEHSETSATCGSKSAVERLVMPDDEAMKWAWGQVKNDCDLHKLTVGESTTYFGFFVWGWNYRAQLEKQRREEA